MGDAPCSCKAEPGRFFGPQKSAISSVLTPPGQRYTRFVRPVWGTIGSGAGKPTDTIEIVDKPVEAIFFGPTSEAGYVQVESAGERLLTVSPDAPWIGTLIPPIRITPPPTVGAFADPWYRNFNIDLI